MCGHFGIVSLDELTEKQVNAFKIGMLINASRGKDSWGVTASNPVFEGDKTLVYRHVGLSYNVWKSDIVSNSPHSLLGHCRHATAGAVNTENTHPFIVKPIVGSHNGTLNQMDRNKLRKETGNDCDTDSEQIYHYLSNFSDYSVGLSELYKLISYNPNLYSDDNMIGRQTGDTSWALVWYNSVTHTVYFHRNTKRSFFVAVSDDGRAVYYASEPWFLDQALISQGIEDYSDPVSLPSHKLFEIPISPGSSNFSLDYFKDGGKAIQGPFSIKNHQTNHQSRTLIGYSGSTQQTTGRTTKNGGSNNNHGKGLQNTLQNPPNFLKNQVKLVEKNHPLEISGDGNDCCFLCETSFHSQQKVKFFNESYLMCQDCFEYTNSSSFHSLVPTTTYVIYN